MHKIFFFFFFLPWKVRDSLFESFYNIVQQNITKRIFGGSFNSSISKPIKGFRNSYTFTTFTIRHQIPKLIFTIWIQRSKLRNIIKLRESPQNLYLIKLYITNNSNRMSSLSTSKAFKVNILLMYALCLSFDLLTTCNKLFILTKCCITR